MFRGFSRAAIDFLSNLKENNNKEWFEANRDKYQQHLLEPLQELVEDLGPIMLAIDPYFELNPRKCISRIHRDVRFSRDKSPYRPNMWIAFKRVYLDWKAEPTYFFEIFPDFYRYGMGFYTVPKETMDELRRLILKKDKGFEKINLEYKRQNIFQMEGAMYKKTLNDSITAAQREWYQRKEIYFVCNRKIDERLFSREELLEDLITGFNILAPVYNFFLGLRAKKPDRILG